MPAMGLRVAFLAAECEPWAKTGGLADVVDALARALGRLRRRRRRRPGRRLPAALPGRARAATGGRPRRDDAAPCRTRGPGRASSTVTIVDVAADGYRLRLVDHPPAFDRAGFYGDAAGDYADNAWRFGLYVPGGARGAAGRRAAGRRPPPPRLAGRARRRSSASSRYARRPDRRPGGDRHDAPQPRLPRLDAERRRCRSSGCAPGDGAPGQNADGIDLLAAGIEAAEIVNTVSPGYAREALTPEFGMGLDGLLRARGDRFIGILNGLDTDGLGSGHGPGPRRALLARRPGRQGGLPGGPAEPRRVRSGRRRPGHRDDRAARSAEGLRPAGRRGPGAARARCPAHRPGRRPPVAGRPVPRAGRGVAGPGRASSSASTATWRAGSTPAPTSSRCRRGSSRAGRAR